MSGPVPPTARRALHGVAELVLAGPQYRRSGTIRLRPVPGGFGTIAEPDLRIEGPFLVVDGRRLALSGTNPRQLAEAAGVEVGPPGIYAEGSGVSPDDPIEVDADAAARLAACYSHGDTALRTFAPDQTPVLWPEHFDLGITLDEVNYGVSPGDGYLDRPYAYVGPWRPRTGEFWNAPFGAARALDDFTDVAALAGFFAAGRDWASA